MTGSALLDGILIGGAVLVILVAVINIFTPKR